MELIIKLPNVRNYDIKIDNESFHSAFFDTSKIRYLTKGEHTISLSNPEPSLMPWGKIVWLINIFTSKSTKETPIEFKFKLSNDTNIVVSVQYISCKEPSLICDEELSAVCRI